MRTETGDMSPVPNGSSLERSLVARTRCPTTSLSTEQADCGNSGRHLFVSLGTNSRASFVLVAGLRGYPAANDLSPPGDRASASVAEHGFKAWRLPHPFLFYAR